MEHYIDLTEIDKKYKDKCSLIKAGKCKNVNIFLENSRELKKLKAENEQLKERIDDLEQELYMAINEGRAWIEKYVNALKEIKEIAEAESYLSPQSTRLLVRKILEKCEVIE